MNNHKSLRLVLIISIFIALASHIAASQFQRHQSDLVNFRINPFNSSSGIPEPPARMLKTGGFERDFGYYIVQFDVPLDNTEWVERRMPKITNNDWSRGSVGSGWVQSLRD